MTTPSLPPKLAILNQAIQETSDANTMPDAGENPDFPSLTSYRRAWAMQQWGIAFTRHDVWVEMGPGSSHPVALARGRALCVEGWFWGDPGLGWMRDDTLWLSHLRQSFKEKIQQMTPGVFFPSGFGTPPDPSKTHDSSFHFQTTSFRNVPPDHWQVDPLGTSPDPMSPEPFWEEEFVQWVEDVKRVFDILQEKATMDAGFRKADGDFPGGRTRL
jgi:hypothetical protein